MRTEGQFEAGLNLDKSERSRREPLEVDVVGGTVLFRQSTKDFPHFFRANQKNSERALVGGWNAASNECHDGSGVRRDGRDGQR